MPRCAARHVKLVAEAEQLVLPFLAPRVFQPWPTTSSSSSTCPRKAFSTRSCEDARQPRSHQSSRPKHESARSLLVQQWYQSALAPYEDPATKEIRRDQQEQEHTEEAVGHVKNDDDTHQDSQNQRQGPRRSYVRKIHLRRLTTSQALVKSRWTVAKQDSKTRSKWVSLGRPVRRKARGEGHENKEEIAFSADGNTLYWNHHFAKLNARYDTRLTHDFTPRPSPNLNFQSQKWATQILNVKELKHLEGLATLLGQHWSRKWMHALLWTLTNSVDDAVRLLEITHVSPYLPAAYITDALSYIVQHYKKVSISDDARKGLFRAVCTITERPGTTPLRIDGNTLRKLLQIFSEDEVLQLFESVVTSGTILHWNTRLHFSTFLAHHGHFNKALDSLLDAVSDGADVTSNQFESCCATILRKAVDQPDGLRVSLRLVQNLSDIGVQLNVQLCNIVMLNAVEADDLKTAFSIYNSLVDNNLKADEYTHAILLKGCKTVIEDSEILNTTIRQAIADVEVRNLYVVATEIVHCLYLHHFQADPENALSIVSEAYSQLFDTSDLITLGVLPEKYENKSHGRMKPTHPVLGIMIGAYLRHIVHLQSRNVGHIHDLYRRLRSLTEHGIMPYAALAQHDYTSNAFMMAFAQDPSGLSYAAEVIRDMQTPLPKNTNTSQKKPTIRSWSIFLHGFAKHGKMELAEQVLTYMRQRKMTPNKVTWNSLLGGYAKLGKAEETVEAFIRMRDEGFEADEVTKRHFGKIKLDNVKSSAWKHGLGNRREVQQKVVKGQESVPQEQAARQLEEESTNDGTDELVGGVHALSV